MRSALFHINKKSNQIIIAVCGPSTCGKSTLINTLSNEYQRKGISVGHVILDQFFLRDKPIVNVRGINMQNWELKESLNWDSLYQRISGIDSTILFIDGFILYTDPRTLDIADVCIIFEYNLNTDFEIALGRRIHRIPQYKNVEIPTNYLSNPIASNLNLNCAYFHDVVWPEMLRHPEYRVPVGCSKPLLKLSATANQYDNYSNALNFISNYFRESFNFFSSLNQLIPNNENDSKKCNIG